MAYHYLIDGYNLLYAFPDMPQGTWEVRRTTLLDWLRTKRPHGRNMATVVFDSQEGSGDRTRRGDIEVVYTAGGTADDWIAQEVRNAQNARAIVVVSNDKGIRDMVRGTGARWVPASDFLVEKPARRRTIIDKSDAESITQEFKDRWLK